MLNSDRVSLTIIRAIEKIEEGDSVHGVSFLKLALSYQKKFLRAEKNKKRSIDNHQQSIEKLSETHRSEKTKLKIQIEESNKKLKAQRTISDLYLNRSEFLKSRIIHLYGHDTYIQLMAAVDCPGGFDVEKYRLQNNLTRMKVQ